MAKKRTRYKNQAPNKKARVRAKNQRSFMTSQSGAGSNLDRGAGYSPGQLLGSPYDRDRNNVNLWYTTWEAKKIVNIPVSDMLREKWEYKGLREETVKIIETNNDDLRVLQHFTMALRLERLIGGAALVIGIADGQDDPSQPINWNHADKKGWLKFINIINRQRISKVENNTDVMSPNYGFPERYHIDGTVVHRDRLVIFDGDPLLPDADRYITPTNINRNDGMGESVLTPIYQDIIRAVGTRQAAFQLVNRASETIVSGDFQSLSETNEGQSKLADLQSIADQLSIFKVALLDKAPGEGIDVSNLSASFGSVPEILMSYLQVLSAGSDIPATRFLGQAPGGLNATGESDLENYYNNIEAQQKHRVRPALMKLLKIQGPSMFGDQWDMTNVDIEFRPLWNLSEEEESRIRLNDAQVLAQMAATERFSDQELMAYAVKHGLIDEEEAEQEVSVDGAPDVAEEIKRLMGGLNASDTAAQG